MSNYIAKNINTNANEYPDQTNIAVTIEMESGNIWEVQTNDSGIYSQMHGCEIYVNGDNSFDSSELPEFETVILIANREAQKELNKIGQ